MTTPAVPFDLETNNEVAIVQAVIKHFFSQPSTLIAFRYVPQFSATNSVASTHIESNRFSAAVNQAVKSALEQIDLSDTKSKRVHHLRALEYHLYICPLNQIYDITLGAFAVLMASTIDLATIVAVSTLIESIVKMKKRSLALRIIEKLSIDLNSATVTDMTLIANAVSAAVCPAETLILRRTDLLRANFETAYPTDRPGIILPADQSLCGYSSEMQLPVLIQDIEDSAAIIRAYGMDLFNRQFFYKRGYQALLIVPVPGLGLSDVVILCCFSRRNAISIVEQEILNGIAVIVSYHLSLIDKGATATKFHEEASRLLNISRHAILMAEIMHDASDDLRAARDNLSIIHVQAGIEGSALTSARTTLANLTAVSQQFREIFRSMNAGRGTGQISYDKKVYKRANLHRIFADIGKKYDEDMKRNRIDFDNKVPQSFELECVPYSLTRAFDNMIRNSIHYLSIVTHRRREIKISLRQQDGECIVSIYDTGLGIPPEELPKVKDLFFSGRGGMGLGLVIADTAVMAHGGELSFESKFGQFCEARIRLPVVR